MRGFLWSQGAVSKGKSKVAWKSVCLPKYEGGLGVKRISDVNIALMCSLIWRLINDRRSLWVKWVHSYKLKGRSFWEVPSRAGITWGWRKLLQLREVVRPFIWSKIGDGKTTSAWHDKWVQAGPLIGFISPRQIARAGFSLQDKVSNIIHEGTWKWPATWYDLFPILIHCTAPVLSEGVRDKLIWCDEVEKELTFSASNVWDTIRVRGPEVEWVNMVWFSRCIPRHSFLLWLVMKRNLKTHDRMKHWDVGGATNFNLMCCSLCKTGPDSHSHLFFECPYSAQVWRGIQHLANLTITSPRWDDIVAAVIPISEGNSAISVITRLVLAAVVYFIWQENNSRMFSNNKRSPDQLLKIIVDTVRLRLVSIKFKGGIELQNLLEAWKLPRSLLLSDGEQDGLD